MISCAHFEIWSVGLDAKAKCVHSRALRALQDVQYPFCALFVGVSLVSGSSSSTPGQSGSKMGNGFQGNMLRLSGDH